MRIDILYFGLDRKVLLRIWFPAVFQRFILLIKKCFEIIFPLILTIYTVFFFLNLFLAVLYYLLIENVLIY